MASAVLADWPEVGNSCGLRLHETADDDAHTLPRGLVLGSVLVTGVRRAGDGYWAWLLAKPRALRRPVACKGRLGLWEWSR